MPPKIHKNVANPKIVTALTILKSKKIHARKPPTSPIIITKSFPSTLR
jgi:hypothetical protein